MSSWKSLRLADGKQKTIKYRGYEIKLVRTVNKANKLRYFHSIEDGPLDGPFDSVSDCESDAAERIDLALS